MTWSKVFLLDSVVDFGFNLVVSDVDAVWFKDPLPLFEQHAAAGEARARGFCAWGHAGRRPLKLPQGVLRAGRQSGCPLSGAPVPPLSGHAMLHEAAAGGSGHEARHAR